MKIRGYFNNKETQRNWFNEIFKKLNLKTWQDWYTVSRGILNKHGGSWLQNHYGNSHSKALKELFPGKGIFNCNRIIEHPWKGWNFHKASNKFWKTKSNQREFLEYIAKELKVEKWEDWYKIKGKEISHFGGSRILQIYNNSPALLLSNVFPEYDWKPWKFVVPQNFWKEKEHRREFILDLTKKLNMPSWESWYGISSKDILEHGGRSILIHFSISKFFMESFPEYPWKEYLFHGIHLSYWKDINNRRKIFGDAAEKLNIKNWEDWYNVSGEAVEDAVGKHFLLEYNNGSLSSALIDTFPEHRWILWKFRYLPNGLWENPEMITKAMEWAAKELDLEEIQDWSSVSKQELVNIGLGSLAQRFGGVRQLLQGVYPDVNWNFVEDKFIQRKRMNETLRKKLSEVFGT